MADIGEIAAHFGFWQAPWWPLIFALFQILRAIGISEESAFALTIPLVGVGWYRIGDGPRHFFLLRPSRTETTDAH